MTKPFAYTTQVSIDLMRERPDNPGSFSLFLPFDDMDKIKGVKFVPLYLAPEPLAANEMSSAPKDGRLILIKHHTWGYDSQQCRQVRTGTTISLCRWEAQSIRWSVWCGDARITSTEYIEPIAWCEAPTEML